MRVVIIVQERTFADALASRLEEERDITVVAALSGKPASLQARDAEYTDIVLVDGDMPGAAAFAVCAEASDMGEGPYVVVMSHSSDAELILAAIRAGAVAWVLKGESLNQLLQAIRAVARGETWLAPAVTGQVVRLLLDEREQQRRTDRLLATLTARERDVLDCLAAGAGRREVAARLNLSENTVRTHLQNLMAKLQVHSTVEAAALTRSDLRLGQPPSRC